MWHYQICRCIRVASVGKSLTLEVCRERFPANALKAKHTKTACLAGKATGGRDDKTCVGNDVQCCSRIWRGSFTMFHTKWHVKPYVATGFLLLQGMSHVVCRRWAHVETATCTNIFFCRKRFKNAATSSKGCCRIMTWLSKPMYSIWRLAKYVSRLSRRNRTGPCTKLSQHQLNKDHHVKVGK